MWDDLPASVLLNLALKADAPFRDRPVVAWLFIDMEHPLPDGLPSSEESELQNVIEDRIDQNLAAVSALGVGRICGRGRWELYFYIPTDMDFHRWAWETIKAFPLRVFETGSRPDPESQQYLEVLYPALVHMQQIRNLPVVMKLEEAGDELETPRLVDHSAYFPDEAARNSFESWARSHDFDAWSRDPVEGDRPWGTELRKVHSIDLATICDVTLELSEECQSRGGEYDGWASPVERTAKPPSFLGRMFGTRG
jgi:hypothetical protein